MKYIDEFRNSDIITTIKNKIDRIYNRTPVNLMEVCGGHTHAICKYGIRSLLPPGINLLSGPGCPVCVTETSYIDKAIALARRSNTIIATYGDMVKVPGSQESLETSRNHPAKIKICYSSLEALKLAEKQSDSEVIFLAVGFETTAPSIAATILEGEKRGVKNFSILSGNKTMPAAMKTLLDAGDCRINGFICPGHVSTITGVHIYDFIAKDYNIPCVVSGFEPLDIMESIYLLIKQLMERKAGVVNQYKRSVNAEGNRKALEIMYEVFESSAAIWRGLGSIPDSGLKLKENYQDFDAEVKFKPEIRTVEQESACICGSIMRGVNQPPDCKLFRKECNPENPIGPCMVSSEGPCSAYYKYVR